MKYEAFEDFFTKYYIEAPFSLKIFPYTFYQKMEFLSKKHILKTINKDSGQP